jgi:hypothetical protein
MLNDKNGCRKISRQLTDKSIESFQTAGRGTDNDDVPSIICHKSFVLLAAYLWSPQIQARLLPVQLDLF